MVGLRVVLHVSRLNPSSSVWLVSLRMKFQREAHRIPTVSAKNTRSHRLTPRADLRELRQLKVRKHLKSNSIQPSKYEGRKRINSCFNENLLPFLAAALCPEARFYIDGAKSKRTFQIMSNGEIKRVIDELFDSLFSLRADFPQSGTQLFSYLPKHTGLHLNRVKENEERNERGIESEFYGRNRSESNTKFTDGLISESDESDDDAEISGRFKTLNEQVRALVRNEIDSFMNLKFNEYSSVGLQVTRGESLEDDKNTNIARKIRLSAQAWWDGGHPIAKNIPTFSFGATFLVRTQSRG